MPPTWLSIFAGAKNKSLPPLRQNRLRQTLSDLIVALKFYQKIVKKVLDNFFQMGYISSILWGSALGLLKGLEEDENGEQKYYQLQPRKIRPERGGGSHQPSSSDGAFYFIIYANRKISTQTNERGNKEKVKPRYDGEKLSSYKETSNCENQNKAWRCSPPSSSLTWKHCLSVNLIYVKYFHKKGIFRRGIQKI